MGSPNDCTLILTTNPENSGKNVIKLNIPDKENYRHLIFNNNISRRKKLFNAFEKYKDIIGSDSYRSIFEEVIDEIFAPILPKDNLDENVIGKIAHLFDNIKNDNIEFYTHKISEALKYALHTRNVTTLITSDIDDIFKFNIVKPFTKFKNARSDFITFNNETASITMNQDVFVILNINPKVFSNELLIFNNTENINFSKNYTNISIKLQFLMLHSFLMEVIYSEIKHDVLSLHMNYLDKVNILFDNQNIIREFNNLNYPKRMEFLNSLDEDIKNKISENMDCFSYDDLCSDGFDSTYHFIKFITPSRCEICDMMNNNLKFKKSDFIITTPRTRDNRLKSKVFKNPSVEFTRKIIYLTKLLPMMYFDYYNRKNVEYSKFREILERISNEYLDYCKMYLRSININLYPISNICEMLLKFINEVEFNTNYFSPLFKTNIESIKIITHSLQNKNNNNRGEIYG